MRNAMEGRLRFWASAVPRDAPREPRDCRRITRPMLALIAIDHRVNPFPVVLLPSGKGRRVASASPTCRRDGVLWKVVQGKPQLVCGTAQLFPFLHSFPAGFPKSCAGFSRGKIPGERLYIVLFDFMLHNFHSFIQVFFSRVRTHTCAAAHTIKGYLRKVVKTVHGVSKTPCFAAFTCGNAAAQFCTRILAELCSGSGSVV